MQAFNDQREASVEERRKAFQTFLRGLPARDAPSVHILPESHTGVLIHNSYLKSVLELSQTDSWKHSPGATQARPQ